MNLVDPTGEILETGWDILNVVADITKIGKNVLEMGYEGARNAYGTTTSNQSLIDDSQKAWEQDKKELGDGLIDAGTDAVATMIPLVPAGGSKLIRELLSVIKTIDKNSLGDSLQKYEKSGWQNLGDRKGGQIFKNNEGSLPKGATYKEYYVNKTPKGEKADSHRFVKGSDGSVYYTSDHYKSFTKITGSKK